ncbi:MAG: PASTA domain-containing protein [Clostridia bacterium]|nr:PASTA domain-containing protein [Clostridia bacterium]
MAAVKLRIRRKIALILGLLFLALFLVVVKLMVIQFFQGATLQAKAEEDRTRDMSVDAARGTIYDCNGDKLALSITADSIAVRPPEITALPKAERKAAAEKTAAFLAETLELDYDDVYDKVTSDQYYVYIKRKVDFELAQKIREADLPGVEIEEETQRYYPKGSLAAHVLGFAGIDNQGLEGVELTLDDWLSGSAGRIVGQYDANNNPIPQAEYEYIPPDNGFDTYLTINENIQYFCERDLANLMAGETPPKNAGIIIMQPKTGNILAMAVANTYDPNNFNDYPAAARRNFLISDSYEPGSVFKIVTLSAALEEGTVNSGSSFYCPGYVNVAGSRIGCWSTVPHGSQNLAEAVQHSCNPAFVAIGQSIESKEKGLFYKYIKAFGLGAQTGVALSGEAKGILQDESVVNQVEIATISIGQGIAVTPLQMITAACAVANDGVLVKPQIVSRVIDGDTVVYEQKTEEVRQIISAETAQTLRQLLVGVVTGGSGTKAAIEGYTIAGKTGTAQKAAGGGYAQGKYVASFLGMVPAEDPELVCLVIVDEPGGLFYGSQVAAPIFQSVISDTLRYLNIPPRADADDGIAASQDNATVTVANVVNLPVATAIATLQKLDLNVKLSGSGSIVTAQQPAANSLARAGSTVLLTVSAGGNEHDDLVTVPDLRGYRFAETANILSVLGLSLEADGSGVAYAQSPDYGQRVRSGSTIKVWFDEANTVNSDVAP